MNGIYGLSSGGLSRTATLQSYLESRLRQRLDANGYLEYAMIWKSWDMRSGPPICALRARARPISDSGFTGWPTTRESDGDKGVRSNEEAYREANRRKNGYDLCTAAQLSGWATPTSRDHKDGGSTLENTPVNALLGRQVQLAGWPSPKAQEDGRTLEQYEAGRMRGYAMRQGKTAGGPSAKQGTLSIAVQLCGWASPCTPNGGRSMDPDKMSSTGTTLDGRKHTVSLEHQVRFAGWASPAAGNGDRGGSLKQAMEKTRPSGASIGTTLEHQVQISEYVVSTTDSTSSIAPTAKRGALNPAHFRWLMGYPPEWDVCGVTATASYPRSQRRSSKRSASVEIT